MSGEKHFSGNHIVHSPIYLDDSREPTVNVGGSVAITGGVTATITNLNGLIIGSWDYMTQTVDTLTDTFVYKSGGISGTTLATVVITYTTAAKTIISTVAKI